jgi:hypothetical protein
MKKKKKKKRKILNKARKINESLYLLCILRRNTKDAEFFYNLQRVCRHFALHRADDSWKQMAICRANAKAVGTVLSAKRYDIIGPRSTTRTKNIEGNSWIFRGRLV